MQEKQSKQQLIEEIENLRREVEDLKREKSDLEILLETTTTHADHIVDILQSTSLQLHESNKQLQAEITERQRTEAALRSAQTELQSLLTVLSRDKADLEIMLETTTQHGDFVENMLRNQCIRDPLTGLFNRRYMEEFLEREIQRADLKGHQVGIILLDIDHFKRINDNFGHQAGDVVLKELGYFLESHIRKSDIACRYGGEEFILILSQATLEDTRQRAEQLRQGVKVHNFEYLHQSLGLITISLGIACYPTHGKIDASLVQAADVALYQSKALGRDRTVTAQSLQELKHLIPSLQIEFE